MEDNVVHPQVRNIRCADPLFKPDQLHIVKIIDIIRKSIASIKDRVSNIIDVSMAVKIWEIRSENRDIIKINK